MQQPKTRARPLAPDDRRASLVDAARRALLDHRTMVSTRVIAAYAGIAEGTIFRVFDTKDDLIQAVIDKAFDPTDFIDAVGAIPADLPLRERLYGMVALYQDRFAGMFGLMAALGMTAPPRRDADDPEMRRQITEMMHRIFGDDVDRFRVSPERVMQTLRMLSFGGVNPLLCGNDRMDPHFIVDLVLDGISTEPSRHQGGLSC
ncbi:TetR/AcrR family transcriptional regulator [Rhodococcus sp. D2-41]|uniref:TetR/AcrR family transcriptional regulator n=1 Tax=Speluncibacter jeojiensis TaxID=2710754 RepID=UPI00240F4D36|nr:TetR/AcrR family transcriptional regulator [Rhodococcus sp. D2-41]MDG3010604.1 TetR/AcrR family transcriptional regulator [Rhodococcus sp. D2-41]